MKNYTITSKGVEAGIQCPYVTMLVLGERSDTGFEWAVPVDKEMSIVQVDEGGTLRLMECCPVKTASGILMIRDAGAVSSLDTGDNAACLVLFDIPLSEVPAIGLVDGKWIGVRDGRMFDTVGGVTMLASGRKTSRDDLQCLAVIWNSTVIRVRTVENNAPIEMRFVCRHGCLFPTTEKTT